MGRDPARRASLLHAPERTPCPWRRLCVTTSARSSVLGHVEGKRAYFYLHGSLEPGSRRDTRVTTHKRSGDAGERVRESSSRGAGGRGVATRYFLRE